MQQKLKSTIWLFPALIGYGLSAQEKPLNILFIMSDDHATQAIGAYGHPLSQLAPTPNIDRIAETGAIFRNNYCCNSISGPSRAAILTGKHSHKNGFMRNSSIGFDNTQETLPKILQRNGYQTAVIGKWHLVSRPTGFDHWIVLNDQGEYNNPDFITEGDTVQYMGYVTDIITDLTKEWLDNRDKSKPFFLMMHHKAVHRNWVPAEKYYHLYEDVKFPLPKTYFDDYKGREAAAQQKMNVYRDMYEGHDLKMTTGPNSDTLLYDPWPHVFLGRMTEKERMTFLDAYRERNNEFYARSRSEREIAEWKFQRYMQDYLAVVKSVDDSVGEMLDYLQVNDLLENTLVVYTTDQGFYLGEHGWFDKRFMYEESFRTPLLVRLPGGKKGDVDEMVQNIDYGPTILDLAGVEVPADMHGVSFLPLLKGEKVPDWRKSLYYHFYEYPAEHAVRRHYGVRTERYKLMHFYNDIDCWELYDLQEDPMEMHNIYGQPGTEELVKELKTELLRLQVQYDDPIRNIYKD